MSGRAPDEIMGMCGRMISGSKSAPPGQLVVWNANLCTKKLGKFWFGDVNVNKDAAKLTELAESLGERVFVLCERDARFEHEKSPRFENAMATATADEVLDGYVPDGFSESK